MGSRVLIVDDEPESLHYLISGLEASHCEVEVARHGLAALQRVQQDPLPDLILLDMVMPGMSGLETLERLRQARSGLKIVMVSNVNDTRKAVQAAQLGAADYLTKPLRTVELTSLLRLAPLASPEPALALPGVERMGDRICVLAGPAMQAAYQQVLQVASLNVPVLLLGESGTGKEVLAHLVHHRSPQASRPFIKVNCAALPADLLESELFGYEPGAFTGAVKAKPGKFELARGGTIFLDEIGEMPASLQAKLLHVLQDGSFTRLGATRPSSTDARIISATNLDLHGALADQSFRSDLYYRLSGFTIEIPPLRERRDEIPVLLRHFMTRFAETFVRPSLPFSAELLEACAAYDWPGNLREMENFVKRYLILADEALVLEEMQRKAAAPRPLPAARAGMAPAAARRSPRAGEPRDLKSLVRGLKGEAEAEVIAEVLAQAHGVRKEAARLLNISYKALLYKLRLYGLDQPQPDRA
ncbi:MAG TPA: sigma-54 dependent transcriptional regulator [Terriglobales bacterium]|nr:sigma-54 dependent transcriptional regulator [Terriglobales bacterium]